MKSPRCSFTCGLLVVAGCASTPWKPLDASALAAHPAHTIGVVSSEVPSFFVETDGRILMVASLGVLPVLVGLAASHSEGEELVEGHRIADPSLAIGARMQSALATRHGLTPKTPGNITRPTDRVVRWDTDLVMTVATRKWGITPFRMALHRYWVVYDASLELRDARDQRVIASGECSVPAPLDEKDTLSFPQLAEHGARGLKRKLKEAAQTCAGDFARGLFGFRLPEDTTPDPHYAINPDAVYGLCRLEGTPAWQSADAAGKQRLLHQCWEERRQNAGQPAPAPQ
jgi:hypothetical protein